MPELGSIDVYMRRLLGIEEPEEPKHLPPWLKEIDDLLKIRLVETIPKPGGDDINQTEPFKAKFELSVSDGGTGRTICFRDVKVTFSPGTYAKPTGQNEFTFSYILSGYPEEITVPFEAYPKSEAPELSQAKENFVKVDLHGKLDPGTIWFVKKSDSFSTQILKT